MTLQWSVVALMLYLEICVVIFLLLPWIRPSIWKKLFNSRFVHSFKSYANIYSYAGIAVLLLLFFDAIREVQKYSHVELKVESHLTANADAIIHMRLFRAQRNLYISGFVLLLFLIISRIVSLLSRCAHLEAAAEAAMKQAEGANKAAQTLMDKNSGVDKVKFATEKEELLKKLRSAEADRDAMKSQTENLQSEYDRVCEELNNHTRNGDKKDD